MADGDDVAAPEHLSQAAKSVWSEVVPALLRRRPVPAMGTIEAYVVCLSRMRDAQGRVDREGLLIADEKGRPIPHPALAIERACRSELKSLVR